MSPSLRNLLLAAAIALPAPLLAQPVVQPVPAPAAAQNDPYQAAMAAMLALADDQGAMDKIVKVLTAHLIKADPRMAELEAKHPGLVLAIGEGLRPSIRVYVDRINAVFRGKVLIALRETLSPDEAREVLAILSNRAMQKLMRIAVAKAASENVLREAASGNGTVTAGAVQADTQATVIGAFEEMTDADMAELAKVKISPALSRKMGLLQQRMIKLRVEMENTLPLPEEEQMMVDAFERTIVTFIAGKQ